MDNLRKIALDAIKRHTHWVRYSAFEVGHHTRMLAKQQPFPTLMEEQLDTAEKALTDALQEIQAARAHYKALPVDGKGTP